MRYQFTYWPLPFRGNFVRNLFAFTDTAFEEISDFDTIISLKNQPVEQHACPFMGPPLLEDKTNDVCLSQMTAIMLYLGEQLGLMPVDLKQKAITIKIIGDCNDVLAGLTRDNGNQLWDQASWNDFRSGRLVRWLEIFQQTIARNKPDEAVFVFGNASAGVADLAIHALFATLERCLPQLSPDLRAHAPAAMAICDEVSKNQGIKALVRQQSKTLGQLYCGGDIEKSLRARLA